MAASDNKKASDDDPIARAMQRAAEKKARNADLPNVGGGMDAVGVVHRSKRSDTTAKPKPGLKAPEMPLVARRREPRDEDILARAFDQAPERPDRIEPTADAPSFFAQSREERAEQARRAALRVRRRTQTGETEDKAPPPAKKPEPSRDRAAPTPETVIAKAVERRPASRPDPATKAKKESAPVSEPGPRPKPAAEHVAPFVRKKRPETAASPQPKPAGPRSGQSKPADAPAARPAPAQKAPEPVKPEAKPAAPFKRVKRADQPAGAAPKPAETPRPETKDQDRRPAAQPQPSPIGKSAAEPKPEPPRSAAKAPEVRPAETGRTSPPAAAKQPLIERMTSVRVESSRTGPPESAPRTSPVPAPLPDPEPEAKAPMIERALPSEPRVETPKAEPRETPGKKAATGGLGALIERVGEKQDAAPRLDPAAKAPATTKRPQPEQPLSTAEPETTAAPRVITPHSGLPATRTRAFAPFEWMIASRYLRARKKEGFVSVIAGFSLVGIMLGVGALIVVMAVMSGFRATLIEQIVGVNPHISVTSQVGRFENYDPLAAAIAEVEGVERATPAVYGQVLASGNRSHSVVFVRGTRKQDILDLKIATNPEASAGSLDEFAGDQGVAIGANLAARLGLRVGDFITLISPDGDITPFSATPMPRKKDYPILYTFKIGLYEYDNQFVLMPFDEAQIYFNKKGVADALEVSVGDPATAETYVPAVRQAARQSISVETWKDRNGSFINALDIERKAMFVILTLIILVAALNIISGLVMLVKDKTRDIAIMRTMGMARGSVLRIFFICGASIGVVGSILGVICGVLFVWNIGAIQRFIETITGARLWDPSVRMLSEVPAKLVLSDVALTLFIALALSFLATLYPAWKASKLDPVEALRYE